MASIEECRTALDSLGARISASQEGRSSTLDRTLSCRLTDLDTGLHGRLVNGSISEIEDGENPKAKIKFAMSSDDLLALTDGKLDLAKAWSSGRVKVDASVFDLLKLRSLMS